MPDGKEQRLEKRQRRPSGFASRRRVDVHQQTVELSPVNQPRQLIKRRGPPTAFFAEPEHLLANPATRLGKPLKPLLRLRESPLVDLVEDDPRTGLITRHHRPADCRALSETGPGAPVPGRTITSGFRGSSTFA
jgi:hypothetical protein